VLQVLQVHANAHLSGSVLQVYLSVLQVLQV
jgi:hypothetical protein